jgi:DNA polymerase-3 subunit gamma/tau
MIRIVTDGSCMGNPGPGGWAAIIIRDDIVEEIGGHDPQTTSNRMELMAAIQGLRHLTTTEPVHIQTDSDYLLKGITEWLPGWKRRGWKTGDGKPVANQELWEELEKITGNHVTWEHIKAHAGHPENERADRLAKAYAKGKKNQSSTKIFDPPLEGDSEELSQESYSKSLTGNQQVFAPSMPYEPLHHKYRPQTFADLVGQEAIATTLTNAIRQNRIAPAYLFTGPRGTGKTSSARILAKSLNCLNSGGPTETPCGECEVCRTIARGTSLDTIEIDAASNTGVDNIRELIERVQFSPVQSRFKVYIVDEVHMLSTAAFNALLKTLEEPPDRVVFVLATTDPQRVLPTIISRCQRFDFRRIPVASMVQHLKHIAGNETINISDEAVLTVAQIAQGGLRDAESLLDQLSLLEEQVTVERVWDLVGSVPERDLIQLLEAIAADNPEQVLDKARELMNRGREPLIVLQNLAGFYRDLLIANTAPNRPDLVAVTPPTWQQLCAVAQAWEMPTILAGQQHLRTSEAQIKNTTQPRLWLEVTLLGLLPSALITPTQGRQETFSRGGGNNVASPGRSASRPPYVENVPQSPPVQGRNAGSSVGAASPQENRQAPPPENRPVSPPPSAPSQESGNREPATVEPSGNLEQTWQTLMEYLSLGSKALLQQHGRLIGLSNNQAQIAIRSPNLFKMAQSKVSDVEAAFFKAFNIRVKVVIQVSGEGPPPASAAIAPSHSEPPSARMEPPPIPMGNGQANSTPQSPVNRENSPPQSPPQNPRIETGNGLENRPPVSVGANGRRDIPQDEQTDDDEVMRAAQRFSNHFNGKLISLPDDPEVQPRSRAVEAEFSHTWDVQNPSSEEEIGGVVESPNDMDLEDDPFGGLDF